MRSKSKKEKKRSQAAIRSLLDLMSETTTVDQDAYGIGGGTRINTLGRSPTEYSMSSEYMSDNDPQQHIYIYGSNSSR